MTPAQIALLGGAGLVAGVLNSVAGGGSLVSFPAALAFGLSPVVANATNAVALMPGSVASGFAYRRELARDKGALRLLLAPAFVGGLAGSVLLLVTPASLFDAIVPLLVLFATSLLVYQNLRPRVARTGAAGEWILPSNTAGVIVLQFLLGVYGGYFGAGMGIMILAILDRLGGADIHSMNGVKSILAAGTNAVASVVFMVAHAVDYRVALVMSVGAVSGGLMGASIARRVKPVYIRWTVVAVGLVLSAGLAIKRWG